MGWNYSYQYFGENTGRLMYAQNLNDGTLDRSYDYDEVGRLLASHSGAEARAHMGIGPNGVVDGPYGQRYYYDVWGNITSREGWGGDNPAFTATYTNNKRNGLTYDLAGNLTNDGGQNFTYDATGQAATASYSGYLLQQYYDGNGLRVKKSDNGAVTFYLRSSVLGGQVVAELSSSGTWQRGYVYLGSQLLAVQQGGVYWVHQDPLVKSKRVTNSSGTVVSTVELDPWGGNTNRNNNDAFQPHKFTNYERDSNASDEAMFRRYNRWWSRFDQPDPYDGSYDLTNPQSFNRYAYVQNDPVNFVDPTGAMCQLVDSMSVDVKGGPTYYLWACTRDAGFGGYTGGGKGTGHSTDPSPQKPTQQTQANQSVPCWTIDRLLADSRVKGAFNNTHKDSKVGTGQSHEEGGVVFEDGQSGDLFILRAPPGARHSMPGFPKWVREVTKELPPTRAFRPLVWFHAHTVSATPSYDDRIVSSWTHLDMPGVLILPSGKGTVVFDGEGEISASNDKRKKCL